MELLINEAQLHARNTHVVNFFVEKFLDDEAIRFMGLYVMQEIHTDAMFSQEVEQVVEFVFQFRWRDVCQRSCGRSDRVWLCRRRPGRYNRLT